MWLQEAESLTWLIEKCKIKGKFRDKCNETVCEKEVHLLSGKSFAKSPKRL